MCLLTFVVKAQQACEIKLLLSDSVADARLFKKLNAYKKVVPYNEVNAQLQSVIFQLHESGYLLASIDSTLSSDSLHATAYLTVGNKYTWASLKTNGIDEEMIVKSGFRERLYRNKKFSPSQLAKLEERILQYSENNGYPFAAVYLDSVTVQDNGINDRLNLSKNLRVKIDSVVIKGGAKISEKYVCNYIGIKEKDLYKESSIAAIHNRIQEIPFLKEIKPFNIVFTPKYTSLILYLDNKKANQFDGILGFLPDDVTGKLLITGQAHLRLLNSFNHGELIDVDWRKLQPLSQDITAKFNFPFILNTPFGTDLNFKLYKKDTTFTDVTQNAGIQYLLRGGNYLKVFINNRTVSLISTKGFENITVLPSYADVKIISYGLGIKNEKLDYRINPRRGYRINATGSVGNKNIIKNARINPVVYDNIQLKSVQYNFSMLTDIFIPILKKGTVNIGIKSAALIGATTFENELLRFGGLNTLRGFDEESLSASIYAIGNVEYRYLFEKNSNFLLFFNGCYYEKNTVSGHFSDRPYGFGAGLNFQTKPGIFTLTYAVGKQLNNPILIRSAKIHFGIVSVF